MPLASSYTCSDLNARVCANKQRTRQQTAGHLMNTNGCRFVEQVWNAPTEQASHMGALGRPVLACASGTLWCCSCAIAMEHWASTHDSGQVPNYGCWNRWAYHGGVGSGLCCVFSGTLPTLPPNCTRLPPSRRRYSHLWHPPSVGVISPFRALSPVRDTHQGITKGACRQYRIRCAAPF